MSIQLNPLGDEGSFKGKTFQKEEVSPLETGAAKFARSAEDTTFVSALRAAEFGVASFSGSPEMKQEEIVKQYPRLEGKISGSLNQDQAKILNYREHRRQTLDSFIERGEKNPENEGLFNTVQDFGLQVLPHIIDPLNYLAGEAIALGALGAGVKKFVSTRVLTNLGSRVATEGVVESFSVALNRKLEQRDLMLQETFINTAAGGLAFGIAGVGIKKLIGRMGSEVVEGAARKAVTEAAESGNKTDVIVDLLHEGDKKEFKRLTKLAETDELTEIQSMELIHLEEIISEFDEVAARTKANTHEGSLDNDGSKFDDADELIDSEVAEKNISEVETNEKASAADIAEAKEIREKLASLKEDVNKSSEFLTNCLKG